jgi:hypothetical protein
MSIPLKLLPYSLILTYQGLEEENLDQKSPGLPGWGLMHQASPLLVKKEDCLRGLHTQNTLLFKFISSEPATAIGPSPTFKISN